MQTSNKQATPITFRALNEHTNVESTFLGVKKWEKKVSLMYLEVKLQQVKFDLFVLKLKCKK